MNRSAAAKTRFWILILATAVLLLGQFSLASGDAATTLEHAHGQETTPPKSFDVRALELADHSKVYAEISHGEPAKGTFVFVNGLIYELTHWDKTAAALIKEGYTVVRYAYQAQPESLHLLAPKEQPSYLVSGLSLKGLAGELHEVLEKLNITEKVHLIGLSYGASIASEFALRHPEKIESVILMSPLVLSLDRYNPAGQSLRLWLDTVRFWENAPCTFYGFINPWLCTTTDFWYDSWYRAFYQTYLFGRVQDVPEKLDPVLYKQSVFHLVRAARDFDLRRYAPRLKNVHIMIAGDDELSLGDQQRQAWNLVETSQKRSFVVFKGASHALPDEAPLRAAEWLSAIASGKPELSVGNEYEF